MSGPKTQLFLCVCCLVAGVSCRLLSRMSYLTSRKHNIIEAIQTGSESTSRSTTTDDVITSSTHRLSCSPQETQSIGCLNGGTCFALMMEVRSIHCLCRENYYGPNCYMYYPFHIDFSEFGKRL